MCILARSSDFLPTTIIECGQDPVRRSNEPIGRIFRFDSSTDAMAVSRIASVVGAVWQIKQFYIAASSWSALSFET